MFLSLSFAAEKITYDDHVVPILRNQCFNCHNSDKKKADFDASSYNGIMAGGGSGKVVLPQDLAGSLLWKLVNHLAEPNMPPKGPKLPDAELATMRKWIEGGLLENSGSKAIAGQTPKVELAVKNPSMARPPGPPPMPNGDLRLEPITRAARAGAISALAASPWAPLVAVGGQHQVLLYNSDSLSLEGILPFPEGFPYVLRFSQTGRLLMAGGGVGAKLGKVVLYDVVTGKRVAEAGNEYDAVLAADLSPDQSQIALGGPGKVVRIFSTSTGQLQHTIKKHTDWITAIAYSPDGVLLATADRSGGVHIWEAESANAYGELKSSSPKNINALAWRDDGNVIATTGEDGQIRLWEIETSARLQTWAANAGGVLDARFAHDGRLVSAGRDRTARLWEGNGTAVRAFEALPDIALFTVISHDMSRVIAGDFSGELRVWDAADGKLRGKLDANPPTLAQRIEADSLRRAELAKKHLELAAAHADTQSANSNAISALDVARRNSDVAAAAVKSAEAATNSMRQMLTKALASRDGAQENLRTLQAESGVKEAAITAANESLGKALTIAKAADDALMAAQAMHKAALDALSKAKAAADTASTNAPLAQATEQARTAADRASALVAALQQGIAEQGSRTKAAETAVAEARAMAAAVQTNLASMRAVVASSSAAVTIAESNLATSVVAFQKAQAIADSAAKAVSSAEGQAKTANAASSQAAAALAASSAFLAAIDKDLVRWKAGQVNLLVLANADEVDRKSSAAKAALAKVDELKSFAAAKTAELAALRKAIAEAPALLAARTQAVIKAQAALDATRAAIPKLQAACVQRDAAYASATSTLKGAADALAKVQNTVKSFEETVASSTTSGKAAAETAVKARAAAEANPGIASIAEAALRAQQAATNAAAAAESAARAVAEVQSDAKRLAEIHAQARSAANAAAMAAADARKTLDQQPTVIKEAETAVAAATTELAKLHMLSIESPGKVPFLEKAVADAAAAEESARQEAGRLAAEAASVEAKQKRLMADYQKAKQG